MGGTHLFRHAERSAVWNKLIADVKDPPLLQIEQDSLEAMTWSYINLSCSVAEGEEALQLPRSPNV